MKQLFLALAIGLTAIGCRDRETEPQPQDQLPPITQHGANTAGCLVDGKIWVAQKRSVKFQGSRTEVIVNDNNYKITIDLEKSERSGIFIKFNTENIELNKVYDFPNDTNDQSYAVYIEDVVVDGGNYYTKPFNHKGKIKITRLDLNKQIISGEFEFKCSNEYGNTINITNGRFDKKFYY